MSITIKLNDKDKQRIIDALKKKKVVIIHPQASKKFKGNVETIDLPG